VVATALAVTRTTTSVVSATMIDNREFMKGRGFISLSFHELFSSGLAFNGQGSDTNCPCPGTNKANYHDTKLKTSRTFGRRGLDARFGCRVVPCRDRCDQPTALADVPYTCNEAYFARILPSDGLIDAMALKERLPLLRGGRRSPLMSTIFVVRTRRGRSTVPSTIGGIEDERR
jgi:hypothetical protein